MPPRLKILPKPENPFEALFGADLDAEREARLLGPVGRIAPELFEPLRRAYQLNSVFKEPAAVIMPYWINIK